MAPEVAKEVRRGIAETYGPHWSELVLLLSAAKALYVERGGSEQAASEMARAALDGGLPAMLAAGKKIGPGEVVERFGAELDTPRGDSQ
jgi:hypothetical protein